MTAPPDLVVLAWRGHPAEDGRALAGRAASRIGLPVAARRAAYLVLGSPELVRVVGDDLLLGMVNERSRPVPSRSDADRRPADRARRILERWWGSFVALLDGDDGPNVLVEPAGGFPVHLVEAGPVAMLCTRLTRNRLRAIGVEPSIRWEAIARMLVAPASAVHLQALDDVRPLAPGWLHPLDGRPPRRVWSAADAARHEGRGPSELREAVDEAVSAMAGAAPLVQLSGGLDSSIVLSSVVEAGATPTGLNFATAGAGGDERGYAGSVATRLNVPLVTVLADSDPDLTAIADVEQLAHPFVFGLDSVFEKAVETVAAQRGFDRVLTGQGGDAAFLQPATGLITVDRVRSRGLRGLEPVALLDDARRLRRSLWTPLWSVMRDLTRGSPVPEELVNLRFLDASVRRGLGAPTRHPWFDDAEDLPPAKRLQLTMLANSQIFQAPKAFGARTRCLNPLLARPVLEAALSLPSFVLAKGPLDRGHARALFADRLPESVVARRTKGDASDHYSRAVLSQSRQLLEFLGGGALAQAGLLDVDALAAGLAPSSLFVSPDYRSIPMLASCEAWARAWR